MFEKTLQPESGTGIDPLAYHVKYGPPAVAPHADVFDVPIQPHWYGGLFPDSPAEEPDAAACSRSPSSSRSATHCGRRISATPSAEHSPREPCSSSTGPPETSGAAGQCARSASLFVPCVARILRGPRLRRATHGLHRGRSRWHVSQWRYRGLFARTLPDGTVDSRRTHRDASAKWCTSGDHESSISEGRAWALQQLSA